ncbi:MAG: helix-turn-helix domain-containing protein [Actinomycetes bacterium]
MDERTDAESTARGRGRPREVERRAAGEGLPYERPLEALPLTAQTVLAAARGIVLERGMSGFTLEAVAGAAHVDVSTLYYHFGGKPGLLEALVDSLAHDALAGFAREAMKARTVEERLRAYVKAIRDLLREGDGSSGRAYFELMPYAYRDPSLRRRIAALNQWHVATSLAIIVGERADSAEIARSAQAIAHLVFAAVDGIELHYDMDPAGYPLDEVFELLLGFVLAETRRLTGG